MTNIVLKIFILILMSQAMLASGDTTYMTLDTVVCTLDGSPFEYPAPYDTSAYSFEWVDFDGVVQDSTGSYVFMQSGSIILVSIPDDTTATCFIDTISINLSFLPNPMLDIPLPTCYTGDPIEIIENTDIDTLYTTISYALSGNPITPVDDTLFLDIPNGDSLIFTAQYIHEGCGLDTIVVDTVSTNFTPQLSFNSTEVCFGDSTTIFNNSDFDPALADVVYSSTLFGEITNENTEFQLDPSIFDNGESYEVEVMISQGICSATETFQLSTLLQPTAAFSAESVCENEMLQITDSSDSLQEPATYSFSTNGQSLAFNPPNFTLDDTLAATALPYLFDGIVTNANGCTDTSSFDVIIREVTYVTFTGLETEYCENQDVSILEPSESPGDFTSSVPSFLTDNGDGTATFAPTMADSDVLVTFSFTNAAGCTDTYFDIVDTIFAKPTLVLDGLDSAYCELDDSDILTINQNLPDSSIFTVDTNGIFFATVTDLSYEFDPFFPVTYTIQNMYTNVNGCFNTITNTTVVNPLPMVSVDSLVVIDTGNEIEIGNLDDDEMDVIYAWSNGDQSSSTFVSQPGIYFISAMNDSTGCSVLDSLVLEYDEDFNEIDLESISIFPNPTIDIINIKMSSPSQGISILNTSGEIVSIGGATRFSTNQEGELSIDVNNLDRGYYYIQIPNKGVFLLIKL